MRGARSVSVVVSVAGLALGLVACGDVYVLSEAEGVAAARAVFAERGFVLEDVDHVLGPVVVEGEAVTFTLDGWSDVRRLGFEYVSEGDADFAEATLDLGSLALAPKLQAAVDVETATTANVLVLRTWGHETFGLADGQLRRAVAAWLDVRATE